MFKEEFPIDTTFLYETKLLADLWYQWIKTDYENKIYEIILPKKKPRKSKDNPDPKLSEEEKEDNKSISRVRIKVENAIWWAKRFWIVSQVFRNKSDTFNDNIMEVSCAMWNLHILF